IRSIKALRPMGEVPRCIRTLWGMATLAAAGGTPRRAAQLAGAATKLSEAALISAYSPQDARLAPLWALTRKKLSGAHQTAAWTTGQGMTLDQALAVALDPADPNP